ncbi:MAG: alanyl-tRNA editing protein [Blastocatellia bacterium]|nr:alanyl-tRNA editing protein [Blastocatellia bacterium]
MKTERLYYRDSHVLEFSALVQTCEAQGDQWEVVLDQTAFYPTGGGQPFDRGTLGSAQVLDCIDRETQVVHLVDAPLAGSVLGRVDPGRRRDHMQQHSGQHLLSQAFLQTLKAETRSFHLGETSSTIDVEIENLTAEMVQAAENLANSVVFDNRPVRIHLTDGNNPALPLRKTTDREGCLRVIEIADFDFSPCGGTHVRSTGEIGLVVIRGWERFKKNLYRVEFLCGGRALTDYRTAHQTALTTAALFSAAREAGPELVAKLQQENKTLAKRIRDLATLAVKAEARELLERTAPANGLRVVTEVFSDRDPEEVKLLAHALVGAPQTIALLGTTAGPRLVFASAPGVPFDCGKTMTEFTKTFGGRGGGKSEFAQGGVTAPCDLAVELEKLAGNL